MGMDVYGKKPTSDTGKYFRNNVWWWRPLADYVCTIDPDTCSHCQYWHSNDGAGLNAARSRKLANALQVEIDTGRCAQYAIEYMANLDAVPDEPCNLCDGSGIRKDKIGVEAGMPDRIVTGENSHGGDDRPNPRKGQIGWCNGCSGRGTRRPFTAHYPFSVENVQEFIAFLRDCGGFRIC